MKLTSATDIELITLACSGNQIAFLALYERYRAGVAQHVGTIIPVREEAEDVVLESFQKAFSQISNYNPDYKFSTWVYHIAKNTALDHLQKGGRLQSSLQMNSIDDENAGIGNLAATTGNPEVDVIRSQEYNKLVNAIEGLSPLYRNVARMVLLDNFGYQEVAQALDLPLNTVKTRVKRAKEQIVKLMEESEEDA